MSSVKNQTIGWAFAEKDSVGKGLKSNNLGRRTEQAKQALVRCIWESNLKAGDRLPPHDVFCKQLGLGKATIIRALNSLKEDGVLATKRRIGTYVVDPQADGHAARVAAVVSFPSADNIGPFYACLQNFLQNHFRSMGWQSLVFYRYGKQEAYGADLESFPGLKRSVEEKRVDAALVAPDISPEAWAWLEKQGMCPCFVGCASHAPVGVFIDYAWVTRQAGRLLSERHCRRLAVVVASGDIYDFVWPAFCEITQALPVYDREKYYFSGISITGGRQIGEKLLALAPSQRPDGLIVLDDQIALGLISALVRANLAGEKYMPQVAGLFNKQIPLDFPVDNIFRFEVDIDVLAARAVDMMVAHVRDAHVPMEKVWYQPAIRLPGEPWEAANSTLEHPIG